MSDEELAELTRQAKVGVLPEDPPNTPAVYSWRDDESALEVITGLRAALASTGDATGEEREP